MGYRVGYRTWSSEDFCSHHALQRVTANNGLMGYWLAISLGAVAVTAPSQAQGNVQLEWQPKQGSECVCRSQAQHPESAGTKTALYTDDEIRKLAKHDIPKLNRLIDVPRLDVVSIGESHALSKVFKTLRIEDARLRDFRRSKFENAVYLIWQVSQSYDIWCVSAINDPENFGLTLTDPKRRVHGVWLVQRAK